MIKAVERLNKIRDTVILYITDRQLIVYTEIKRRAETQIVIYAKYNGK